MCVRVCCFSYFIFHQLIFYIFSSYSFSDYYRFSQFSTEEPDGLQYIGSQESDMT